VTAIVVLALMWIGLRSVLVWIAVLVFGDWPQKHIKLIDAAAFVLIVAYWGVAFWFFRPAVAFTLEEKSPWIQGPDDRTSTKDYAVTTLIKPTHKLIGVTVGVVSITKKTFEDRDEHPLNSNIEIQIGWLGGSHSYDPVDIDVAGRPWPIVFITPANSIYLLCDTSRIFECGHLWNLEPGVYELTIRVHSQNETDIDQKIEFDWFGKTDLFKIHLVH